MNVLRTAAVFACTAGALGGLAAPAAATSTANSSAADVVTHLQDQGYSVQINGSTAVPLSQCLVTGVHGVPNAGPAQFTTVYVDVSCASDN